MKKPNGYDEAKASNGWEPVELGGHYLVIKQVEETKSSSGDDMIKVFFDFDKNDKQADYFADSFKNDIRPDKKWAFQATEYIMVNDYQDKSKTSRAFKTFITCVEHSNNMEVKWDVENWAAQFKGKKIGGVFGEQMDYYNGEEKKKVILRWFVSTDNVEDAEIPKMTESKAYKNRPQDDGFTNVPDDVSEELPF